MKILVPFGPYIAAGDHRGVGGLYEIHIHLALPEGHDWHVERTAPAGGRRAGFLPAPSAYFSARSCPRCRSSACSGSNTLLESMPPWQATTCRPRHRRTLSPSRERSCIATPGLMWSGCSSFLSGSSAACFSYSLCCVLGSATVQVTCDLLIPVDLN